MHLGHMGKLSKRLLVTLFCNIKLFLRKFTFFIFLNCVSRSSAIDCYFHMLQINYLWNVIVINTNFYWQMVSSGTIPKFPNQFPALAMTSLWHHIFSAYFPCNAMIQVCNLGEWHRLHEIKSYIFSVLKG